MEISQYMELSPSARFLTVNNKTVLNTEHKNIKAIYEYGLENEYLRYIDSLTF